MLLVLKDEKPGPRGTIAQKFKIWGANFLDMPGWTRKHRTAGLVRAKTAEGRKGRRTVRGERSKMTPERV